jgi:heme-degrading monooxygenase HmoA
MSVFITLRIKADPSRLQEAMASNEARWQAINSRAKGLGAIHHRFMASADGTEIIVLDEWESAEAFQKFFEASDDIRAMMGEIGVTSEPEVTFWHALDTPDAF